MEEVKYIPRPHAQPLRYRVASDELIARTSEASYLRMQVRKDVLKVNDPSRLDLYVYGDLTMSDGTVRAGLSAITQDDAGNVIEIRHIDG